MDPKTLPRFFAICLLGTAMLLFGCERRYEPAQWREVENRASNRQIIGPGTTLPGTTLPGGWGTTLPNNGTTIPNGQRYWDGTTLPR